MKKTQGKNVRKAATKTSKEKTKASNVKNSNINAVLKNAKKKMTAIKKQSSKGLKRAKDKVHATEEEIVNYVKENPVKSISTVALAGLIAGFVAKFRK